MEPSSPWPLNVAGLEPIAAERLEPQAYDYYRSGAGDELTLPATAPRSRASSCSRRAPRRLRGRSRRRAARHRPSDAVARRADRVPSPRRPDGELATSARRRRRRARSSAVDAVEHPGRGGRRRRRPARCGSSSTSTGIAGSPRRWSPGWRPPATRRSCSPSTRRCSAGASATSSNGSSSPRA